MKKFLLLFFAAALFTAPAIADDEVYGTSPATAKPFPATGWHVEDLATAPAEAWFTFTNETDTPVLWGSAPSDWTPGAVTPQQVFAYLCDNNQSMSAFHFGGDESDSYVILPGQTIVVKVTPKVTGFFCNTGTRALPESMKGTAPYYPEDRSSSDQESAAYKGQLNKQKPGTTVWYLYDFPYPAPLSTNSLFGMPVMDITKVEAIHIECPGGTNIGEGLIKPYVKAGKSVIGVTTSADATELVEFIVNINAQGLCNCGTNLLRGQAMVLDQQETYPDAYYTVDRFFKVPEDGTYTFTNHGAEGTILNVGKVILTDPDNQYKYECDWTDIKSATVGNEDAVISVDLKKDEIVIVQSDAFGVIGAGMENQPYLMVTKGSSSVVNVAADRNSLKVAAANGVLSVESVLLASGAEVAVYDMNANKVASANAAAGAANLEVALDVPAGIYVVVVYGKGNSESAKIVVK